MACVDKAADVNIFLRPRFGAAVPFLNLLRAHHEHKAYRAWRFAAKSSRPRHHHQPHGANHPRRICRRAHVADVGAVGMLAEHRRRRRFRAHEDGDRAAWVSK